jgi:hypothetical protein
MDLTTTEMQVIEYALAQLRDHPEAAELRKIFANEIRARIGKGHALQAADLLTPHPDPSTV